MPALRPLPLLVVRFEQGGPVLRPRAQLVQLAQRLLFGDGGDVGNFAFEEGALGFASAGQGLAVAVVVVFFLFGLEEGFAFVEFVAPDKV